MALGMILAGCGSLDAQAPAANRLWPNLESNIERPLRYRPDNGDFIIENGSEFFNRPLYGGNTAFRVDGGDKPEFVLYLPGRGGNLRLALHSATGVKWLHDAVQITTRYRPGELLYEIRDPLLGPGGVLRLAALAWHQTEGLVVRVEANGLAPDLELVWVYGGANGQRGRRDGDIGTENVPIGEWFQLRPEFCRDHTYEIAAGTFTLHAKPATITGLVPAGTQLAMGDAAKWNDLPALLASASTTQPPAEAVVIGRSPLVNGRPLLLSLQRVATDASAAEELDIYKEVTADRPGLNRIPVRLPLAPVFAAADLPRLFGETEAHFAALRNHVSVDTPDPFLNAAVGALNVAADAVWDEPQQAIMHGAIAWRTQLLGWRGPYALDALGWPDRARAHFAYWAGRQNTDPIPEKIPPPDEKTNLARSEAALHSNGDLSNSHYDMNLVYIDALFRHLRWTGDIEFARKMWPVIERHLAWERRLFRREYGPEKLPLYEAYAAIWASDDLQYSGGGTAHASAYNYWHNREAARLARLLGYDPAPYEKEAAAIHDAMITLLWTADHFAENKDWLGMQLVHREAALWTFYHAADSGIGVGEFIQPMAHYVEQRLPHLPVKGPGVPADRAYAVFATSNWLPYDWSINNVVMAENVHTALGFWQAGRPEQAFTLLKASLLAAMYMGISPGNIGSMSYLDVYRRESQRDFADGSGILSRAVIEGLFGVRPDTLAGELVIAPGFPADWNHATLHHPQIDMAFRRDGKTEHYVIKSHFAQPLTLRLQLAALERTAKVVINGIEVERPLKPSKGYLEVTSAAGGVCSIVVDWQGEAVPDFDFDMPQDDGAVHSSGLLSNSSFDQIDLHPYFNDRVTQIFKNEYRSPRSPFVSLALPKQGLGGWAGGVNTKAEIDDTGLRRVAAGNNGRLVLPNGLPFATPGPGEAKNIIFTSQWDNYPHEATVPLTGKARQVHLLMAGSTNPMQSRLDNGEVVVTYADGTTSRLALRNPDTWWPIEQDYFTDDYQFRLDGPLPPRVDLKTGQVRLLNPQTFKGQGRVVPGGAATVLDLPLDAKKELRSLTVRTLANDVVIGLMAATLAR